MVQRGAHKGQKWKISHLLAVPATHADQSAADVYQLLYRRLHEKTGHDIARRLKMQNWLILQMFSWNGIYWPENSWN